VYCEKEVSRLATKSGRGKADAARAQAGQFTPNSWAGLVLTPARWIADFMFLSAFIRRVISQPVKLDPTAKEYVGHSFAHFLPHSIVITPFINYLVQHPHVLFPFMVLFTALEGLVGLLLIIGLLTRLSSIGSGLLSLGILLGSGWLGSTCVDEWQIGSLLVGLGGVIAVSGGGPISLDALLARRWPSLEDKGWFRLLFSGDNPQRTEGKGLRTSVIVTGIVTAFIMLATYQAFHNGLWGKLYNDSKLPQVQISGQSVASDGALHLTLYRSGGPDTYGAFIVAIQVLSQGKPVEVYTPKQISALPKSAIKNELKLSQAKVNHFALVLPLAAKTSISLPPAAPNLALSAGQELTVIVYDVSGQKWSAPAVVH
jgi:thiosulfate dehydrogenase [quinone] large subunit